jgi:hypothetical protein
MTTAEGVRAIDDAEVSDQRHESISAALVRQVFPVAVCGQRGASTRL